MKRVRGEDGCGGRRESVGDGLKRMEEVIEYGEWSLVGNIMDPEMLNYCSEL